jgi:hypothetical protein
VLETVPVTPGRTSRSASGGSSHDA